MTDLLSRMATARSAWASSAVKAWYSDEALHRHFTAALDDEARQVGDADVGRRFRDAVGLPGIPDPLDWANRLLDLPGGGWAVTHLRFRLGDPARPFVDVVATTAPPTPEGLAHVATAVLPVYEAFAPLCLRVEVPSGPELLVEPADDDRFGRCAVALHVVAGLVDDLRRHPRATSSAPVGLRPAEPARAAGRVSGVYAELAGSQPQSVVWAGPEDAESLAESADQDLLFDVLVGEEEAGVVAAVRDDDHGLVGFTVKELCLDARHRGRRLAAATLQHLLDELPSRAEDVLWGTIHPGNHPSLRNALSIGRTTTSSLLWVAPTGHPGMPADA